MWYYCVLSFDNVFQELAALKKALEEETQVHEVSVTDMRHKHSQEIATLNEQIEQLKKVRYFFTS